MQVLRTPDKYFEGIKDYPFKPVYTEITSSDGTPLRIHHIDEGPRDGPILLAMHRRLFLQSSTESRWKVLDEICLHPRSTNSTCFS